jgi:TM2 domain-containing membrane protein YozV
MTFDMFGAVRPVGKDGVVAPVKQSSVRVAYLLLVFFGIFGAHKFYLGRWGQMVAYFCTLGFLGFGILWDYATLWKQVEAANRGDRYRVTLFDTLVGKSGL